MSRFGALRLASTRCSASRNGQAASWMQSKHVFWQRRELHAALLTQGIGDALAAMPGAGKDNKGHISVPVPDARLARLAELERTKAIPAIVEVVELEQGLIEELTRVGDSTSGSNDEPVEFSGKFLSSLRAADALILAVPCSESAADPVQWLKTAELALVSADLHALEQQICKDGNVGPDAELDIAKLRKSLSNAKDPAVRRDADNLIRDVLVPGFTSLRNRLRAGFAARGARSGLCGIVEPAKFEAIDTRIEDLGRGWLNALVTWKPMCVLADVPEADAGDKADEADYGNELSRRLSEHAREQGIPCITVCTALEGEVVGLREEPEFLTEYLASFGLREADGEAAEGTDLRQWTSRAPNITCCIPKLFNLLTYYTAGEKEARAWMCARIRKDGSPLSYDLFDDARKPSQAPTGKASKAGKGSTSSDEDGVPAPLAARAIHTSFETRLKNVELWNFDDLDALGVAESGPGAKDRAKSAGKVKKLPAQALLQDGDIVEFGLN